MNDSEKLVEKTITSEKVFGGRLLHVFFDEVRLPDGGTSTREYIKHPGASAVVPIFENGDVMMVKQFRYPMGQIFYEVPAGKIDAHETADDTAARELREEAGLTCRKFQYVGHFYPGIGYSDEIIHIYLAWDITSFKQQTDVDEFVINTRLPFTEAIDMVHSGEIADGKTVISLLRSWHWWQLHKPFPLS